jgi:hypothetical protein
MGGKISWGQNEIFCSQSNGGNWGSGSISFQEKRVGPTHSHILQAYMRLDLNFTHP